MRIKLRDLDTQNNKRIAIAKEYLEEIDNEHIILPQWSEGKDHVWHLFVVRCVQRDALQEYLKENGIATIIHYPVPPHKQEALQELGSISLRVCEQLHSEVLSLPISPSLTKTEITQIIKAINDFKC